MILLDTQAWLWWMHAPEKLSSAALKAIRQAEVKKNILVSAISVWEVAVKVERGKLTLSLEVREWYSQAKQYPGIFIEPLSPEDAIHSTLLPDFWHKDPADRILIAIARRGGIQLVTSDKVILDYPHVETIW